MKKKLLSILVALVVCISPMFFFSGCSEETDQGVTLKYTTWTVVQHGGFSDSEVTGLEITYSVNKYDAEKGEYVNEEQAPITDLATAIANGLGAVSGFDSSVVGEDKKMIVMFGGQTFEITYNVVAA